MAFRSRARGARPVRKRAVWCNVPFGGVAFTESVGNQLLLTPEDWEAQFSGNSNETAVLRACVGVVTIVQTVVGTLGNDGFWGIYIADKDATVPPVFTVAGMGDVDWLLTGAVGVSGTLVSQTAVSLGQHPVRIKAKRRLKSRDAVFICAQYGADAAAPAGIMGGLLRFLVARD